MTRQFLLLLAFSSTLLAQGRRGGWERMKQSDANGDGKISRDEFPGPDSFFERLDGNEDGFITEEEAREMRRRFGREGGRRGGPRDGSRGGPGFSPQQMMERRLVREIDEDEDREISESELEAFFARADKNGDMGLDLEEWQALLEGGRRSRGGSRGRAPAVGTAVPSVRVKHLKEESWVDLSQPRRTTVLIFGSYT